MRLVITVLALLAVPLLAAAQSDTPKPDFDFVCAMTAGAQTSLKQDERKAAEPHCSCGNRGSFSNGQ